MIHPALSISLLSAWVAAAPPTTPAPPMPQPRPHVDRLLEAYQGKPAYVREGRKLVLTAEWIIKDSAIGFDLPAYLRDLLAKADTVEGLRRMQKAQTLPVGLSTSKEAEPAGEVVLDMDLGAPVPIHFQADAQGRLVAAAARIPYATIYKQSFARHAERLGISQVTADFIAFQTENMLLKLKTTARPGDTVTLAEGVITARFSR